MKILTKALGEREISPSMVYYFPHGLYAFEEYRYYALLKKEEESIFTWLQSIEEPDLAFITVSVDEVGISYEPDIPEELLKKTVDIGSIKECSLYLIVTIPPGKPEEMSVNLQGPLLLHPVKRMGVQVISLKEEHITNYPLLELL